MKLVIDIPESEYYKLRNNQTTTFELSSYIKRGTPLSKVFDSIRGEINVRRDEISSQYRRCEISSDERLIRDATYVKCLEIIDSHIGKEHE